MNRKSKQDAQSRISSGYSSPTNTNHNIEALSLKNCWFQPFQPISFLIVGFDSDILPPPTKRFKPTQGHHTTQDHNSYKMHFFTFNFTPKTLQQKHKQELTIGYAAMDEPPEEEEESYDIISDEEMARLKYPFCPPPSAILESSPTPSRSSSTATMSSQGSSSSLGSWTSSVISNTKPSGFTFFKRRRSFAKAQFDIEPWPLQLPLPPPPPVITKRPPQLTEEEMTSATTRIWFIIQLKGHYNHGLEDSVKEDCYSPKTMDNSSGKMTNWLSDLANLPVKIKRNQAEKCRFNIHEVSNEMKEELKHLYVY